MGFMDLLPCNRVSPPSDGQPARWSPGPQPQYPHAWVLLSRVALSDSFSMNRTEQKRWASETRLLEAAVSPLVHSLTFLSRASCHVVGTLRSPRASHCRLQPALAETVTATHLGTCCEPFCGPCVLFVFSSLIFECRPRVWT